MQILMRAQQLRPVLAASDVQPSPRRRRRRTGLRIRRGLIDDSVKDIEVSDTVENLELQDHLSSFHFEGCRHELVKVVLDTQRFSGGSFLKGELWANYKLHSWEECIDSKEAPFPLSAGHLDITQAVASAIETGFPRLLICGQDSCVSSAVSGVDGTDQSGWSISAGPHANAFSCLKDLRDALNE